MFKMYDHIRQAVSQYKVETDALISKYESMSKADLNSILGNAIEDGLSEYKNSFPTAKFTHPSREQITKI